MCRATVSTVVARAHHRNRDAPSKPSKTALKKAAKAARQEKKQQQQSRAPPTPDVETSEPGRLPSGPALLLANPPAPEARPAAASDQHLVGPPPPIESTKPLPIPVGVIAPPIVAPLGPNGLHVESKGGPPRPTEKPSVSSSIPQLARPTTKDQSFPPARPSSSPFKPMSQPSESKSSPPSTEKKFVPSSSKPVAKPVAKPEADNTPKKSNNVLVRTLWTFIMIGGFLGQFDK